MYHLAKGLYRLATSKEGKLAPASFSDSFHGTSF
jgi:hypothetical protein